MEHEVKLLLVGELRMPFPLHIGTDVVDALRKLGKLLARIRIKRQIGAAEAIVTLDTLEQILHVCRKP